MSAANCLALAALLAWAVFRSLSAAIDAPTLHLDGAFQTASALFRLDSGQLPGRDFFPYLGIGPLLSLYPAFKAFGSNLAASVISAHFMTFVLCWLSVSLLWHLIARPASFASSLVAGACYFGALTVAADYFSIHTDDDLGFASGPGLSLRPIRAAAPYLVVACYYLGILNLRSVRLKSALCGVVTGAILLWSNDFAVPSAGLFAILVALNAMARNELNWRNALLYFVCAVVSWLALLCLVTLGHPMEMLRYNFVDVAADQWWYFSPYEEGSRVFELRHLLRIETPYGHFAIVVLLLASLVALWTRRIEHVLVAWIGFVLLAGGVVACVGGHVGRYFAGLFLWAVFASLFGLLRLGGAGIRRFVHPGGLAWPGPAKSAAAAAALLLALAAFDGWQYRSNLLRARSDPARFHVPELGAYLRAEWIEYVDLARKTDTRKVLEEYWGIWSATRKIIPGWPVDSVIHALGRTREVARATLKDADVIISTRYATSSEWQPWSLAQNFWFYDELIGNWTPREASPTTVVWRRNRTPREDQGVECRAEGGRNSVVLDVAAPGFHRVTIEYELSGAGQASPAGEEQPALRRGQRRLRVDQPWWQERIVSRLHFQGGTRRPGFTGRGQRAARCCVIHACHASRISLADDEVLHVPGSITDSFYMTDDIWSRGVARDWAGFFVPNIDPFVREYRPGRVVTLADGDTRTIVRVEPFGRLPERLPRRQPAQPEKVRAAERVLRPRRAPLLPDGQELVATECPGNGPGSSSPIPRKSRANTSPGGSSCLPMAKCGGSTA